MAERKTRDPEQSLTRGGKAARPAASATTKKPAQQRKKVRSATAPSPFGAPKQLAGGGVKKPLVQEVYEALLAGVDDGTIRPGQRIKAAEIAKRLGLSRAPVREALHVLAGQGIVELMPDRGAVMRSMSISDMIQIYEVIQPIASIGVVAATRRIIEGDNAERVRAAMERIHVAGTEPPSYRFYLALNELHFVLNQIAQKPYVDHLMRILNIEYWNRFLAETLDLKRHMPTYVANYARMTESILAGDGRAAAAILLGHTEWSISLLRAQEAVSEAA